MGNLVLSMRAFLGMDVDLESLIKPLTLRKYEKLMLLSQEISTKQGALLEDQLRIMQIGLDTPGVNVRYLMNRITPQRLKDITRMMYEANGFKAPKEEPSKKKGMT